eukprot:GGOE01056514.1.p1 GENE.GGOE01056514.1~~GGOE01056514.1.p1  ORF type:complete len:1143 (-),score=373.54 GGOE01056514.1:83-3451(-)
MDDGDGPVEDFLEVPCSLPAHPALAVPAQAVKNPKTLPKTLPASYGPDSDEEGGALSPTQAASVSLRVPPSDAAYLNNQGKRLQSHLSALLRAILQLKPRNPGRVLQDCVVALKYNEKQHSVNLEQALKEWLHLQEASGPADKEGLSLDSTIIAKAGDGIMSRHVQHGRRVFFKGDYHPGDLESCMQSVATGPFQITSGSWVLCQHCRPQRPFSKRSFLKHLKEEHPTVWATAQDEGFDDCLPPPCLPDHMLTSSRELAELVLGKLDLIIQANPAKPVYRPVLEHIQAINLYTMQSDLYSTCNRMMRDGFPEGLEQFRPYIWHVHHALVNLPIFEGSTFRGIDCAVPSSLYDIDSVVTWQAFTSSSKNPYIASLFLSRSEDAPGTLFVLWGHTGRLVKQFSMHMEEDEVLHDYNSQWRVARRMHKDKALLAAAMKRNLDLVEVYELHELSLHTWGDLYEAMTHSERVLNRRLLRFIDLLPLTWKSVCGRMGNFPPVIEELPLKEFQGVAITPIHLVAAVPQPASVLQLICANLGTDLIDWRDGLGRTALSVAVTAENVPCALFLLLKGASPALLPGEDDALLLLYWACEEGNVAAVGHLLSLPAPPDMNRMTMDQRMRTFPLAVAAENGRADVVQLLCEKKADIDQVHPEDGTTALWNAAYYGFRDVVEGLVRKGANPHAESRTGESVLYAAAQQGHNAVVCFLVEECGLSAEDSGARSGNTPLMAAAHRGQWALVQFFCQNNAAVNVQNALGWTALLMASQLGHTPVVQTLLDAAAEVDRPNLQGTTPLHLAALNGFAPTVHCLLEAGANIQFANRLGTTALHMATREGQRSTTELLLERRADANAADCTGLTPLMGAAQCGHAQVVQQLLAARADLTLTTRDGLSAFHLACIQGMFGTADVLLHAGASIQSPVPPPCGASPLIISAWSGNAKLVARLVKAKGSVNVVDGHGYTALMVALLEPHPEVVRELLQAGARWDVADRHGWTAAFLASLTGCLAALQLLVEAGADLMATTLLGQTVMHAAAAGGHLPVVRFLQEHGVDISAADHSGVTPWMAASLSGQTEVAQHFQDAGVRLNQSYCDRPGGILAAADRLQAIRLQYQTLYDRFSGMFWGKDTMQE